MWYAIEAVILLAITAAAASLAFRAGRERAQFNASITAAEQRIEANRAAAPGRHWVSQPRAALPLPPSAAPSPGRPQPSRTGLVQPWYTPPRRYPGRYATTAADIRPVFMPPQPAPSKHGAADSGLIPRVRLENASTGEMRAITDTWIANHCPGMTV